MAKKPKIKCFTPEGHPIAIYKKGKKHKVFVDLTTNEVIMTNPLPLAALAAPYLLGAAKKAIPGLIGKVAGQTVSKRGVSPEQYPFPQKERLSIFEKALMAKALDR